MAKKQGDDEEPDLDEIPPLGFLLGILFLAGIFLTTNTDANISKIQTMTAGLALLGTLYFSLRFKQITQEQSIKKAFSWTVTPLADRKKNEFNSPSAAGMMPSIPDVNIEVEDNKDSSNSSLGALMPDEGIESLIPNNEDSGEINLKSLRSMDEYKFEELVGDVWAERGWETQVTKASNDKGIDIVAEKDNHFHQKAVIQAKRYSKGNKVGSKEIQQYYSLKEQEDNVDQVIIISTSSFTSPAERRARDLNVKLINGEEFLNIYNETMVDQSEV